MKQHIWYTYSTQYTIIGSITELLKKNGLQHFFYTLEVQVSSLLKPAFIAEDNPNSAEKKTHEKDSITCTCLTVMTEAQEYL